MAQTSFIIDIDTGNALESFLSSRTAQRPVFVVGDQPTISVSLVTRNGNNVSQPWRYVDLAGQSLRVAVGKEGGRPTAGSYTLTYAADTTAEIEPDATDSEVEAALNALASITSAGGVSVSSFIGGAGYRITFNSNGARSLITADTDKLSPSAGAYIAESVAGGVSAQSIQVLALETHPAAYVDLTTDLAAPSINVSSIRAGVLDSVSTQQRVTLTGAPYAGTYSLTIAGEESTALSYNAEAADVVAALESLPSIGLGNVTVTGEPDDYTLDFASSLGDVATATADASNLNGAVGKTGELNLNTTGAIEYLAGAATQAATLEVVRFTLGSGLQQTVHQGAATLKQDLIASNPTSATPLPSYTDQASHDAHLADTANPHAVTKAQIGLSNVDNTSDDDKPVSTAQAAADNLRLLKTDVINTLTETAAGKALDARQGKTLDDKIALGSTKILLSEYNGSVSKRLKFIFPDSIAIGRQQSPVYEVTSYGRRHASENADLNGTIKFFVDWSHSIDPVVFVLSSHAGRDLFYIERVGSGRSSAEFRVGLTIDRTINGSVGAWLEVVEHRASAAALTATVTSEVEDDTAALDGTKSGISALRPASKIITAANLAASLASATLTLADHADDAAAGTAGLTAGQLYRTGGTVKIKL